MRTKHAGVNCFDQAGVGFRTTYASFLLQFCQKKSCGSISAPATPARQRRLSLGFTSKARATSAMLCAELRRFTTVGLNFFHEFPSSRHLPVSLSVIFWRLTGCLKMGVHSTPGFARLGLFVGTRAQSPDTAQYRMMG
jgi:hypothetical protein